MKHSKCQVALLSDARGRGYRDCVLPFEAHHCAYYYRSMTSKAKMCVCVHATPRCLLHRPTCVFLACAKLVYRDFPRWRYRFSSYPPLLCDCKTDSGAKRSDFHEGRSPNTLASIVDVIHGNTQPSPCDIKIKCDFAPRLHNRCPIHSAWNSNNRGNAQVTEFSRFLDRW